ncbi:MAG: ABC transporter ATP-binding protein [Lachnospiraceae bacterium]|nr:ABC transporter ATP-binding protein [Lachnospiraceae bacterium]
MVLDLRNIKKSYKKHGRKIEVINGFDLTVRRGEMVALMGESGAGKSTILNIIGGLVKADSGEMFFEGEKIDMTSKKALNLYRKHHVGFIVQDFALIKDRTVYENIELPLKIRKKPFKERDTIIKSVLLEMGLSTEEKSYPSMMSGGEQQRVAIARALAIEPDLILADEPTGSLDEDNAEVIMNLLRELCDKDKAVLIVTHSKEVANKCDRIIKLKKDTPLKEG